MSEVAKRLAEAAREVVSMFTQDWHCINDLRNALDAYDAEQDEQV